MQDFGSTATLDAYADAALSTAFAHHWSAGGQVSIQALSHGHSDGEASISVISDATAGGAPLARPSDQSAGASARLGRRLRD